MVIVRAQGGLGNQMYQYALYKVFLKYGKDCRMSLYSYTDKFITKSAVMHAKGYLIDDVFGTKTIKSNKKDDEKLGSVKMDTIGRLLRKYGFYKKTHFQEEQYPKLIFNEKLFSMDNVYLDGYWQSVHYLEIVEKELRQQFEFARQLEGKNEDILRQIQSSNAVSIHVRRNDYVSSGVYVLLGEEYYSKAINLIRSKVDKPLFFCFGDDMEWCKKNIIGEDIIYVDWNKDDNSYIDMQLMSNCKHNITANSSFSFWGAWLNSYEEKCVIRPKYFYNNHQDPIDYWPEEWISM